MPWGKKQAIPITERPVVTLHINGESIEVHLNAEKADWPEIASRMTSGTGSVEQVITTNGHKMAVRWDHIAAITWGDQS